MISRWSPAKIIVRLTFDCARRNFLDRGKVGLLHSFDCNFNSGSKSLTYVSSIATVWYINAWLSTLNLCFSNVAISRRFCFCSAVKHWGTYRAEMFLFCTSFVKIRNNDVGEIPVARRSTILCKKVCHTFHTSFICWCFRPSWPLAIVYGGTSFTKTSSPTGNCTTVHFLLTTNFTQSTMNFCWLFATLSFNLDVRSFIFNRHSARGACRRHV